MIVAVVQIPMPRRSREAAIAAQTKSAPTDRALADKELLRKDYLNGGAGGGGGGIYYWTSHEAAETWYTPEWRRKAKETFGAEYISGSRCIRVYVCVPVLRRYVRKKYVPVRCPVTSGEVIRAAPS